jgi:hypothetical protein
MSIDVARPHTDDSILAEALRRAEAKLEGSGLSLYRSEYLDLVIAAESDAGPIALVAGTHTHDFPYAGTEPWDNCLLLVGSDGYTFTARENGPALSIDFDQDAEVTSGDVRFQGTMRRARDGASTEIEFEFPIDFVRFPERLLGEPYNFLDLPGLIGMQWTPWQMSGASGHVRVDGSEVPVRGVRGAVERGRLTNLRAHDFAIQYDYLAVAKPGDRGYGIIEFTSHALHPEGVIGRAIDFYLRKTASAQLTIESGLLVDDDVHGVYNPPHADASVVLFEEVVDLGMASLQRQMIRTHDEGGNSLLGLREIFTAKSG